MSRKSRRYRPGQQRSGQPRRASKRGPRAESRPFEARASRQLEPLLQQIGIPKPQPFVPDPFQRQSVAALEKSDVLVTAPTGAGKTWIAVEAIGKLLKRGERSWYASPLKALSNAKYTEFSKIFGRENVGILTGDRKENPEAPVIVGTTEILRNQLYDSMYTGTDLPVHLVVLDEAHYLGDADRGVVWEEVMIYLPQRVRLLLLSATVSNARQIAAWLEWLRRVPCRVISVSKRPVPLHPLFMLPDGEVTPLLKKRSIAGKVRHFLEVSPRQGLMPRAGVPDFSRIIGALRKLNLLPAIFFLKSRQDCNQALMTSLPREGCREKDRDRQRLRRRLRQLQEKHPYLKNHRQIKPLLLGRVAAHHGGQLPVWKALVETLMIEGELEAIFSTSTVAAGVNFPARTVVLPQSDRFNGREFVPLSATDLQQMNGRAGRRGMDKVGFVLLLPGPYQDPLLISSLFNASPEPISSQIQITFTMVLNLLLSHSPDEVRELLSRSFATYQNLDLHRQELHKIEALQKELSADLQDCNCASVEEILHTLAEKRQLQGGLAKAQHLQRQSRQRISKELLLTPGRVFRSKKGYFFVVVQVENRRGVAGVKALRLNSLPSTSGGAKLKYRWFRLERVSKLLDICFDLPVDLESWLRTLDHTLLAETPVIQLNGYCPASGDSELESLGNRVARLEEALNSFPCSNCRSYRRCNPANRSPFKDKINRLLELQYQLETVTNRLWHEFSHHFQFLQKEGYVDATGQLTAEGQWAAKLRLDQPLLIAEAIRTEVLPFHDSALLAGLIAPFVSDKNQLNQTITKQDLRFKKLGTAFARLARALRPLRGRLRAEGFPVGEISFMPAAALYIWTSGAEWQEVLGLSGLDEGDLAMLIYRTADNLRQLEGLEQTHTELAHTATQAIQALLREPVLVPQ